MKVNIDGILLEKSEVDRVIDGKQVKKKIFLLYQRGEKVNAQVTVTGSTYDRYSESDHVSIYCRAQPYAFGGRVGISLTEITE